VHICTIDGHGAGDGGVMVAMAMMAFVLVVAMMAMMVSLAIDGGGDE
jgi:hypothetical protein